MIEAPLALGFAAGMLAAFNPCGFALLPAYLGYFLGAEERAAAPRVRDAILVAASVSAGFVLVFGIAGLIVAQTSVSIQRYVPWLTIAIGLGLIPLGIAVLRGYQPKLSLPRLQRGGDGRGPGSMFVFGVSYATVSLTCTLPVFVAAVVGTFRGASFLSGAAVFGAYTLGMTAVLVTLTVAVALARRSMLARVRRILPYVNRISGILLIVAGAYVAYYGVFDLAINRGADIYTGPVDVVAGISGWISTRVDRIGATRLGVGAAIFLAAAVLFARRARRARPAPSPRSSAPAREPAERR